MKKHLVAIGSLACAVSLAIAATGYAAKPAGAQSQASGGQVDERPLPTWGQVEQIVKKNVGDRYGYQPGDIISRTDVQQALAKLEAVGWRPIDRQKILKATPGDDEFIVTRLRNPEGWNFMRHIATYPEGYDRVDRLLHMPRGEAMVTDLITNPGGYKLFQYMTSSQGGIEMGRMLESIPSGHDFNDPTNRIYTVDKLLARLKQSYDVEKQRRRKDSG